MRIKDYLNVIISRLEMVFIFVILKMLNFQMMELDLALVSLAVVILELLSKLFLLEELRIRYLNIRL